MSTAATVDRWPLVGRWHELETFDVVVESDARDGVVLFGPAGVGKTRLADEMRARLERDGRSTLRAVASRTAASAPLGALAHLLPADVVRTGITGDVADAAIAFKLAADAFAESRPVMAIDDMHLLDATSLTLLGQLVANGLVFLIGTVRTDELQPEGITTLLGSDRVTRIDLDRLARDDVDTLLHLALGGPLDGASMATLWNASEGNVLFLRELVLGALGSGALVDVDGVWTLQGALTGTGRLGELLAARVRAVDADAVPVLELLAVCGAVGVDEAGAMASMDALAALERTGLVTLVTADRRRSLALAHPLYGELLRESIGELRAGTLLTAQADRVQQHGARRREDPLLVASWQLEAGATADPLLLLRAAKLARFAHDFRQVRRLSRAALRELQSLEPALLLGEALYELGRFDDAETVLAPADDYAEGAGDGSKVACDLAIVRSQNLVWGLGRVDDALAVRRRARACAERPEDAGVLLVGEASESMFKGGPAATLALLDPVPWPDEPRARVARAIVAAGLALAFSGRTVEALEVARRGFEEHGVLGDLVAMAHPGSHVVAEVLALTEAGGFAEAEQLSNFVYEISLADNVALPRMWATLNLGRVTVLLGRPATARRWFMECAAVAGSMGFGAIRRLALSGIAMSAALLGDAAAAIVAADELAPVVGEPSFVAPELWLGAGWAALAQREPARARELFATGAAEAERTGHYTSEAWLLHEIARIGDPEAVTARLAVLADVCDSPLVAARARHAEALARHDGDALSTVSDEFAALGANLVAAEAATAAVDAYRRGNEARRATAMQEQAATLVARCEDAQTPGLIAAETVVPLTRREREIAMLAADGITSKQIGERLFLSARTVDNHLQRVYTKLGVTSRAELADALNRRGETA